jgi:hypothetical protein
MPISQINTNSIASNTGLTTPTFSGNTNMTGGTKYQVGGVTTNALAWVNFNGTATSGSATIRASYNVSSITVTSAGVFTLNFANATTDANYSVVGAASPDGAGYAPSAIQLFANGAGTVTVPTTSAFLFTFARFNWASTLAPTYVSIAVFGN